MDLAFAGLGGPDCDPQTGMPGSGNLGTGASVTITTAFRPACTTRSRASAGTARIRPPGRPIPGSAWPRLRANTGIPAELLRWTQGAYITDAEVEQVVFDLVLSGDAVYLPSGPLGLALGFQYRRG